LAPPGPVEINVIFSHSPTNHKETLKQSVITSGNDQNIKPVIQIGTTIPKSEAEVTPIKSQAGINTVHTFTSYFCTWNNRYHTTGMRTIKIIPASQANSINTRKYMNTKLRLLNCNVNIYFNRLPNSVSYSFIVL
jgi:hypothetical protein